MRHLIVSIAAFAALCCGDLAPPPTGPNTTLQPGYTECGTIKCSPGQFCDDPRFSACLNGCLSNVNCASDQECKKAAGNTDGSCVNKASTTNPPPMGEALAACQAACDKSQTCGYFGPGDVVDCKSGCSQLSGVAQQALADCVKNASCTSTLPSCFNSNCGTGVFTCCGPGPSYTCPSGKNCLGHVCT